MAIIVTDRLILRRFRETDWQDLLEYLSDAEVVKFEPYAPFTEQQARDEARKASADDTFQAVCLKKSGKLIGNLYLGKSEFATFELGYVFNRAYQGQGYATEAARALLDHAFEHLGARRIIAMCNPLNSSSWRLLERLQMRREGHLLENISFKSDLKGDPIWQDTYEYAILKKEWPGSAK